MIVSNVHNGTFFKDGYGSLWELVAPATGPLHLVGFAWVEVQPGSESPLHFHRLTEELYFIVRGTGEMTLGVEVVAVGPGATIAVPIGAPHKIRAGDSGLDFVVVTSPPYDAEDDIELGGNQL
jgi:mannose-6-phosphate isomerase-like protein (cupin superfamily)